MFSTCNTAARRCIQKGTFSRSSSNLRCLLKSGHTDRKNVVEKGIEARGQALGLRGQRFLSSKSDPSSNSSSSSSSMFWRAATFGVAGLTFLGVANYLSDPTWRYPDKEETDIGPIKPQAEVTSQAFFDIDIDGKPAGRILFGLHGNVVPKTVQNFETICKGDQSLGPIKLSFTNTIFHRIIPGFMLQGGDFTRHNGTGGSSIWGKKFADESFTLSHTGPGILSMANSGPNTNGSQFFITTKRTSHLDGRHVVFGVVQDGLHIVKRIEQDCGSNSGKPRCKVVIAQAGLLAAEVEKQKAEQ